MFMMKSTKIVATAGASLVLVVLNTFAQEQRASTQETQKSMGPMSMEMMHQCMAHCGTMSSSMEQLSTTVEQAQKSNDLAQMRAALAAVQKHMSGEGSPMKGCMNMMNSRDGESMDHGSMDHSKMKMEQDNP